MASPAAFIKRIPRRLAGLFVEDEPLIREDLSNLPIYTPPFGGGMPVNSSGRIISPTEVRKAPTKLSRALPDIIRSGIVAAATPSTAGGATDVFGAMVNAQNDATARDQAEIGAAIESIRAQNEARRAEAELEMRRVQAIEAQRRLEESRRPPEDKIMSTHGGGLYNVNKHEWVVEPEGDSVEVDAALALKAGHPAELIPEGATTIRVSKDQAGKIYDVAYGPPERPSAPYRTTITAPDGTVRTIEIQDGRKTVYEHGAIGTPPRATEQREISAEDATELGIHYTNRISSIYQKYDDADYWRQIYGKTVTEPGPNFNKPDMEARRKAHEEEVKAAQTANDEYHKALGKHGPSASDNMRERVMRRRQAMLRQWNILGGQQNSDIPNQPAQRNGTAEGYLGRFLQSR